MYKYVVLKRQGVQNNFHENQSDAVAYLDFTGSSREESLKTDKDRRRILKA